MKSSITVAETPSEPLYPYLGIWSDNSLVVLFTKPKTGTCIYSSDESGRLGEYGVYWAEDGFRVFNGKVEIEV